MYKNKGKYSSMKKRKNCKTESISDDQEENSRLEKRNLTKGKRRSRQRLENSLGELTKNFINYIKEQEQGEININDVVKELKVKKRRIYDITNVLEGIGYIKKIAKNKIQWIKDDLSQEKDDNLDEDIVDINLRDNGEIFENELNQLNNEEKVLDCWIEYLKYSFGKLSEEQNFKEYGYITFDDIKALTAGEDINLIAIKAPVGTSVEIPEPDQIEKLYTQTLKNIQNGLEEYDKQLLESLQKKYQLFLDSPNGEINVYLVLNKIDDDSLSDFSSNTINNGTNRNHLLNGFPNNESKNSYNNNQKDITNINMINNY